MISEASGVPGWQAAGQGQPPGLAGGKALPPLAGCAAVLP
jgi:hypothetical protein